MVNARLHSSSTLHVVTVCALLGAFGGTILAARAQEAKWSDLDPVHQMADWEDASNWGGFAAPNAPGANAFVNTPKISKYLILHQPTTLGTLMVRGSASLAGGILAAEGSGATLRFDRGEEPAVLSYSRDSRETINVPIEFARDLIVTNGSPNKSGGTPTALFFDSDATFTPLCADGKASLTFSVHSRVFPWRDRNFIDRKNQNAILGYVEDSLDGAPLSFIKEGPGALSLACCDNAYSGGTTLREGFLYGINAENLDPPFLPFGTNPKITLEGNATLALLTSKSGIWGPDKGYMLDCAAGAKLSLSTATEWNNIGRPGGQYILSQIDSLHLGGSNLVVNTYQEAKLRIEQPLKLAQSTSINIQNGGNHFLSVADLDLPQGIQQVGNTPISITKTGNGMLHIGADSTFSGGFTVVSGAVAIASAKALGTGPVHFKPTAMLILEGPAFKPTGGITLDPGTHEIWRHPLARLGSTPDEKAGCRISPEVRLGIAADLRDLKNKTIVLDGGRLYPYRDHDPSPTNSYTLGPGITLYSVSTNLSIGTPWVGKESEFARNERFLNPFSILGPIREHGVSTTLHKDGNDRLELGGICSHTGGTIVHAGVLSILPSGHFGPGEITVCKPKPYQNTWMRLTHPNNLDPNTTIYLENGARLQLDYEGELTIRKLFFDGKPQPPGVWATNKGQGITRVETKRFLGRGRLRITE